MIPTLGCLPDIHSFGNRSGRASLKAGSIWLLDRHALLFGMVCHGLPDGPQRLQWDRQKINRKIIAHLISASKRGAPMSPGITRQVIAFFQTASPKSYDLSNRELLILSWLVKGYGYKMVAVECMVSYETVNIQLKKHLPKIARELWYIGRCQSGARADYLKIDITFLSEKHGGKFWLKRSLRVY